MRWLWYRTSRVHKKTTIQIRQVRVILRNGIDEIQTDRPSPGRTLYAWSRPGENRGQEQEAKRKNLRICKQLFRFIYNYWLATRRCQLAQICKRKPQLLLLSCSFRPLAAGSLSHNPTIFTHAPCFLRGSTPPFASITGGRRPSVMIPMSNPWSDHLKVARFKRGPSSTIHSPITTSCPSSLSPVHR